MTPTKVLIRKGLPVPTGRRPGKSKWPFAELEVGDSFLIGEGRKPASVGMREASKRLGRRFKGAWDKDSKQYGIWRLPDEEVKPDEQDKAAIQSA